MKKLDPREVALDLWKAKYPRAKVIFLAGSVMRGEGTEFSDLDLVVVFDELENAWREPCADPAHQGCYRMSKWEIL